MNSSLFGQNDYKLYNEARKFTYKRKWNEAIKVYDEIRDQYPDSRYVDDSYFWKAYVLEKNNNNKEAFQLYKQLIINHPASPWVDDALIHQIMLAEKFVQLGEKKYLKFLTSHLSDQDKDVRYQAALSLGKLGENVAIPVLQEIKQNGDEDLKELAKSALERIANIEGDQSSLPGTKSSDIDILLKARKDGELSQDAKSEPRNNLFFKTKRYNYYRKLNKTGEDWTELELITYGLWHILPEEQFEAYFLLNNNFDKKEWLRKFWKKWDPTPTTPENERKDEFMRRIEYARINFGEESNYDHLGYLKEQYLRKGWSVAPWDSRGELYVKYGEPDFRDTSIGHRKELWTYYRYNFDVFVNKYVTNIFGNGISIGPMSKITYKWNLHYVENEFIYNNEFRFEVYKDFKPIKNFKITIDVEDTELEQKLIKISYLLSGKDLKFKKIQGRYFARFKQNYAVFNEDLDEVTNEQKELVLQTQSKDESKGKDNFKNLFEFEVPPGYYTLAVRIKDVNSDKLGIFLKEFEVKQ